MGIYAKSILFARRLSVLGLFVGIFSVFFGGFYYRYMPANQAELDTRGFRILNQLEDNMAVKNRTVAGVLQNVGKCEKCSLGDSDLIREQIRAHLPFSVVSADDLNKLGFSSYNDLPLLQSAGNTGWSLIYGMGKSGYAIVRMEDFIQPVLAARDDFFEAYVLLQDSVRDRDRSRQLKIIYVQNKLSSSFALSVDSALALQKNSDLGDISDLNIGGEVYTLFFRPFGLAGSKLVLGGLIRKGKYDSQVKTLPTRFVVGMILVIFIGLIILPFLKVFLLSPRENIHKWDVLGIVLATFLGAGVFVLAGVYFLADCSAQGRVERNLRDLSDTLSGDIRRDMQAASRQLQAYTGEYKNLGPCGLAGVVAYKDFDSNHNWVVDKLFTPTSYPLVARLIWFDSLGNTTAKWNPFTFLSPRSPMKDYDFFSRLKQKNKGDEAMVFGAGKSNITGEFQLSLSRLDPQPIAPSAADGVDPLTGKSNGFAVVMAFYLTSGEHPVLPRGYGFCLVDKQMKVLMHSDARRNLAENFYKETGENAGVKNFLDLKKKDWIRDVDLYGTPHTLYVRPVIGEDISLIVFYDNDTHAENIFRMIHFGAETLLYLSLLFFLCLLLSVASLSRPSKLSFTIDLVEWVRPIRHNCRSYDFTVRYFKFLLALSVVLFIVLLVWRLDIRIAFYTSLLLPFFGLWGFIASRRQENALFPPGPAVYRNLHTGNGRWNWRKAVRIAVIAVTKNSLMAIATLVLLNLLIWRLFAKPDMDHGAEVIVCVALFQLLAIGGLCVCYYRAFPGHGKGDWGDSFSADYTRSIYYAVLVMTIIPVLGCLWYGWSVEKIQFLRSDELFIAEKNRARMDYIVHDLRTGIKPTVLDGLDGKTHYTRHLLHDRGRYLAGETITPLPGRGGPAPVRDLARDPDKPYITLLDELYLITAGEYNSYSIERVSGDASWAFISHLPDSICLVQTVRRDAGMGVGGTTDSLLQDFCVSAKLGGSLFTSDGIGWFHGLLLALVVLVFLFGLPFLLRLTVKRVFLLDFIRLPGDTGGSILGRYFDAKDLPIPEFTGDAHGLLPPEEQEEYILRTMLDHQQAYGLIWDGLSGAERYFLYDFARDGYTNYKDSAMLIVLLHKGLLQCRDDRWSLFAPSFREFVRRKKGTEEIATLKAAYAVPGVWSTIRMPVLIIITACAVLLFMTQESVSHKITVAITSVGAIVPIIMEITKRLGSKGAG